LSSVSVPVTVAASVVNAAASVVSVNVVTATTRLLVLLLPDTVVPDR
jgi:hypothetical protein